MRDLGISTREDLARFLAENEGVDPARLVPLPHPYEDWVDDPIPELSEEQRARLEVGPDGVVATQTKVPGTEEERERAVARFLEGIRKLLDRESNWTFLQPLLLSLENCMKCQTCAEACPVFTASGGMEIYRPTFRAEILRRIVDRYIRPGGGLFARLRGDDIELDWDLVVRLAELSYRCTLCRRCAQHCPVGVDNGLIARELRKLFSQELGISMPELHELGTIKQLEVGSSTGLNPMGVRDVVEFAAEDFKDRTGLDLEIPFDRPDAEVLVMHNAGEFLSWPENLQAFSLILDAAGVKWTLASELVGYDSVNYGLFYDDVQYSRIVLRHFEVAKKLGVGRILVGECGHAHKAMMPIADRLVPPELKVPVESAFVFLDRLIEEGRLELDPSRNDFPVTLHDPCNVTRSMGIVEPQRRILRRIAPRFREMEPHGVHNFCCGGGSGFAICQSLNFPAWRVRVAGRIKFRQILEAFSDSIGPDTPKYVCAPCSNCKGQMRDLLTHYEAWERCRILYGGLVELIANAMPQLPDGFIEWEMH